MPSRKIRQDRPLAEQHEEWTAHLRRQAVSRRTVVRGAVGAAAGSLLLGSGRWADAAAAATLAGTGTIAGGFVVNGRHLSFGEDPATEMRVGGQLLNVSQYNAVPPRSVRVFLDYGRDRSYGAMAEAEIRELITHVPVWDGKPGDLRASRTLNADQFFVHARLAGLSPGTQYHYRFRYTHGGEVGVTPDGTFITAPRDTLEPFTFTAFADEGIPGPSLDQDPSLLPESDWGMWNNGSYDSDDPDRPTRTGVNTTSAVILQITKVRNLTNRTPARFNLLAGDLCYAQAQGDIQPIINPNGPNGKQPSSHNTPRPPAHSGGWDYYDPWIWSSWFPMIEPSASAIPWMFASGNHEPELFSSHVAADHVTTENYEPIGYGGLVKRLDLPQNGPSACPSVYSFTYGNVGIVSLDANDLSWEIQGLLNYSRGAQLRWLEALLSAWRTGASIDFIVAFFHECAFSTSNGHSSDGGVRAGLGGLFAEFQVDLAVQGHNHVYERTNPLLYDPLAFTATSSVQAVSVSPEEPAEVWPARDGTTYVTVGTAGTPRYGWTGAHQSDRNFAAGRGSGTTVVGDAKTGTGPYSTQVDFSRQFETVDWSQARYADYGFIALDVTPASIGQKTTMVLRFINQQGRELDRVVFNRTAGVSR
ncbi:MAG TPA: metallophosphoesterase [Streptosporangiaceae bacterium]|nr:metallophosphoesterase [Streptosporangiaceae bacterium]